MTPIKYFKYLELEVQEPFGLLTYWEIIPFSVRKQNTTPFDSLNTCLTRKSENETAKLLVVLFRCDRTI